MTHDGFAHVGVLGPPLETHPHALTISGVNLFITYPLNCCVRRSLTDTC